jgi:hypothetical protein
MSSYKSKMATLRGALFALGIVAGSGAAMADAVTVTLTAKSTSAALPDGQNVPMWGYFCDSGPCTAMNGSAQTSGWQPPLIRVPAGSTLSLTLKNWLSFGSGDQNIPTSIVIEGLVGGGLGDTPSTMASPIHAAQGTNGTPLPVHRTRRVAEPTVVVAVRRARSAPRPRLPACVRSVQKLLPIPRMPTAVLP